MHYKTGDENVQHAVHFHHNYMHAWQFWILYMYRGTHVQDSELPCVHAVIALIETHYDHNLSQIILHRVAWLNSSISSLVLLYIVTCICSDTCKGACAGTSLYFCQYNDTPLILYYIMSNWLRLEMKVTSVWHHCIWYSSFDVNKRTEIHVLYSIDKHVYIRKTGRESCLFHSETPS